MSTAFYKSVIEDEMQVFGIKMDSLKAAAKSVATSYSRKSLSKGNTFLDYNIPSNRCAYLYKYASIHSGLVTKHFRKLEKKKDVKSVLRKKESIKICCLGGGPGTDIVGLFRALAVIPHYHQKIVEVTVLDICGGWRNSFKRVISNLISGKIKGVPDTFVNSSDFKFKLIEVNLLDNLSNNVAIILAEADIICMVKFVSAILGYAMANSALKVIGEKLKIGAVVLFIDNFQGNVFKPLMDISGQIGLKIVDGPLHERFDNKTGYARGPTTSAEKEMFGCLPLFCTKVTVLSFIKISPPYNNDFSNNVNASMNMIAGNVTASSMNMIADDDDDDGSWDTEDESEESSTVKPPENSVKSTHKFVQTDIQCSQQPQSDLTTNSVNISSERNHLGKLIDSLCDLVNAMTQWQQQMQNRKHCHHCH